MSRVKNLVSGVSSSYLAMGANIVYTMGSIPLALHYLSKDEFGLWALVFQLAGYLALLDFGMNTSVSRILIDHKDSRDGGRYGSIILTAGLVFATQGALVAAGGCLLSPFIGGMAHIPAEFAGVFGNLFAFQCVLLGLGFLTRIFGAPLYAHQRYDVSNLSQAAQLLIMFAALWLGFHLKMRLYSMVFSGVIGFLWAICSQGIAAVKLGFYPKRGCWGGLDKEIFRELFFYGKDVFLIGLGWQLMSASQVIIVSRVIGLDAAATWSICTKMFILAQQFVWRIYDFSVGAFSEMLVRGEIDRLKKRFRETLVVTGSVSLFVAAIIALCNGPFVNVWTRGQVSWHPLNDALLGVLLVVYSVNRCHAGFVGVTKKIGFTRYIYFMEGVAFVAMALLLAGKWKFPGIIASAIVVDVLFPGLYGLFRSKQFFGASFREMVFGWLGAPWFFALTFSVPALALYWLVRGSGLDSLFIRAGLLLLAGGPLFWIVGIPKPLRREIKERILGFLAHKQNKVAAAASNEATVSEAALNEADTNRPSVT